MTLDDDPDFRMHAIVADAPLAHFRRVLGKRIEQERMQTTVQETAHA